MKTNKKLLEQWLENAEWIKDIKEIEKYLKD